MSVLAIIAAKLRKRSRSIVVRLVLFAVLVVVIGTIVRILFLSDFLKGEIGTLSAAHQLSMATYVAGDVDEKIMARIALLQRLAMRLPPAIPAGSDTLRAWIRERQDSYPLFSLGLLVAFPDGRTVTSGRDLDDALAPAAGPPIDWFRATSAGETAIGRPFRGAGGEPLIALSVPVTGDDGGTVAVLAGIAALDAPGFLNLVQDNRIGRWGGFLLVSPRDRLFVAAGDPRMVLRDTPPPGVNPLHDRAMAGYRGTGVTVNAQGVEELSAIVSVPAAGWFLVARVPTDETFSAVDRLRRFISTVILLPVLVLMAVFALVLRRMLRPLTDAAGRMHQMALGRAPLELLPVGRMDEVGELVFGFNHLLGKLREQEEALRESEARMAHMAHHDALTGLPNRAMFEDRLHQAIVRAERNGTAFALLYIDLNDFKPVNDAHGHAVGDELLRQVAQRLAGAVRRADTVARIGGDEFAILLMDQQNASEAAAMVCEKCHTVLATPIRVADLALTVGASIGGALYPVDASDADRLIAHADQAMYTAKRTFGRHTDKVTA